MKNEKSKIEVLLTIGSIVCAVGLQLVKAKKLVDDGSIESLKISKNSDEES